MTASKVPFHRLRQLVTRMPISLRMFLILLLALLPLAVVAALAAQQLESQAQSERAKLLQQNVDDSAQRLQSKLALDMAAARSAANRIALGEDGPESCTQLRNTLSARRSSVVAIIDAAADGSQPCIIGPANAQVRAAIRNAEARNSSILANPQGALFIVKGRVAIAQAALFYPSADLFEMADPVEDIPISQLELGREDKSLALTTLPRRLMDRLDSLMTGQADIYGLRLMLRYERERKSSPQFLSLVLPFLTVIAAALIGFLVVNRMLIEPMSRLLYKMRRYETGQLLPPMRRTMLNASEIEELDNAFLTLTGKVATDKQALDEGLEQQIRLTREVHHRVKNNLQIIASLISLHARTADTPEADQAYSRIRRRVDALSVVHRNHYAETEQSRGIDLRALVGELAGSFEAGRDDDEPAQCISFSIENICVDQDIGVPIAFLLTEVLDLVTTTRPGTAIRIIAKPTDEDPDKILLILESEGLKDNAELERRLAEGIDRVLIGLARQLRTPFERDLEGGRMCITIPRFKACG